LIAAKPFALVITTFRLSSGCMFLNIVAGKHPYFLVFMRYPSHTSK